MTPGQVLTCLCLLALGGLAGLWVGYKAGWHHRGSQLSEVTDRVVNTLHARVGEHDERIERLEGRRAA